MSRPKSLALRALTRIACLGWASLVGCQSLHSAPPSRQFQFLAKPCASELAGADAICGTVDVPENYAVPFGRRIQLGVVVFTALEPGPESAAQFDIEGGPGFAVTESASFYAADGVEYRRHRDVVLTDMRGAGSSHALRCPALEDYQRASALAPLYPPELIAACAAALASVADVRQYTTAAAARDLDSVRQALGYRQIDLNALSYGTTLALRYIADYPERVRTAVLTATVPADRTPPRFHASAADRAIHLLFDACAADSACAAQYPDLPAELSRATARLDSADRAPFLERIRTMLYLPRAARRVPSVIRQIAAGNLDIMETKSPGRRDFADGLYLSVTCSESLARMDVEQAIRESDQTTFGSYRLTRQRDACARWPTAAADLELFATPRWDGPILFISGALDPVAPPEWSAETVQRFPNGKHVVVPQGAHVLEGLSGFETCMDPLVLKFVAQRSVAGIDWSCIPTMDAGPFAVP